MYVNWRKKSQVSLQRKHLSKAHSWRHPTFDYASGTICNSCGQKFHTRRRQALHWRRVNKCFKMFYHTHAALNEDEISDANHSVAAQAIAIAVYGFGMRPADKPACRIIGPVVGPPPDLDELAKPPGYRHVTVRVINEKRPPRACTPPAPFGQGSKFVINIFSGQRQEGEIQSHLEDMMSSSGNHSAMVLSVDIINHSRLGSLMNPDAVALWMTLLTTRAVIGRACGPPSQTSSAVRHMPP